MRDIQMSDEETALWHEAGTRGDAFRRAMHERAGEHARTSGKMTEIIGQHAMVDAVFPTDPDQPASSMVGAITEGADTVDPDGDDAAGVADERRHP